MSQHTSRARGTGDSASGAQAAPAGPPTPLALEATLGFRLDRVQRTLRARWAADLEALGLTPPLAAMLRGVRQHRGTSIRGLARVLGADAMTVKRGVDELESRRLVRTTAQPGDRRPRCLEVTPGGERTAARVDELARAREAVFGALTIEQRQALGEVLGALERSLDITNTPSTDGASRGALPRRGMPRRTPRGED